MTMEALAITFTFCQPVVRDSEHPIQLDALLAWAVAQEAEEFGSDNAWSDADDLSHLLERSSAQEEGLEHPDQWVWKASQLVFTPTTERFMQSMVRKLEPEAYSDAYGRDLIQGRGRTYINSGSGQERAYQFLMPYQWMEKATAWCVGDAQGIREALSRLHGIGKLTRNGYGQIRDIEIQTDERAAELWRQRILPAGMRGTPGVPYAPAMHCLRAPYWKKTSRQVAQEPVL